MKGAALADEGKPGQRLRIRETLFGFQYRAAPNAVQHQFVPNLIGGCQFFSSVVPVPFTSLTALIKTPANDGSNW